MKAQKISFFYFLAAFAILSSCTSIAIFGINHLLVQETGLTNNSSSFWIFTFLFQTCLFASLLKIFYALSYRKLRNFSKALMNHYDPTFKNAQSIEFPRYLGEAYSKMMHSIISTYEKILISTKSMESFHNSGKEADFIISNLQEILRPYLGEKLLSQKNGSSVFFSLESRSYLGFALFAAASASITIAVFFLMQGHDILAEYQNRILVLTYLLAFAVSFYMFGEYQKSFFSSIKRARFFCGEIMKGSILKNQDIPNKNLEEIALLQDLKEISNKIEKSDYESYLRQRKRQMQERLIRNEMTELINTLDSEFRHATMTSFSLASKENKKEGILGFNIIVSAFQKVSRKLQKQHSEMQTLIKDLRSALKDKEAYVALQKELEVAKKVQLSILPKPFKKNAYVMISGKNVSAREIGGDFYDYFHIEGDRIGIAIGDVSGKGIPAALFMASARVLLRSIAQQSLSPSQSLQKLNNRLIKINDESMFVTLLYGILNLRTGTFSYSSAGHHHPYVITKDQVTQLKSSLQNLALGVLMDTDYTDYEIILEENSRVFVFTDGVTEAMNENGEEFSETRLKNTLADSKNLDLNQFMEKIMKKIQEFVDTEQNDDITYLSFEFTKKKIT